VASKRGLAKFRRQPRQSWESKENILRRWRKPERKLKIVK
jgi:hypothetical protein